MGDSNKLQRVATAVGDRGIVIRDMDQLARFALTVKQSNSFKSWKDEFQVAVAVQTGLELGMTPIQALNSFYPTPGGRTGMYYHAALALMRKSPVIKSVRVGVTEGDWDSDSHAGYCRVVRTDENEPIETKFSVAEAKRAGLWQKRGKYGDSAWVSWSEDMLVSKAVHRMARQYCSDVLLGIDVDPEPMQRAPEPVQAAVPESSIDQPTPTTRTPTAAVDPLAASFDTDAGVIEATEEPEPEPIVETLVGSPPDEEKGEWKQIQCPHCQQTAVYPADRRTHECENCKTPFVDDQEGSESASQDQGGLFGSS